MQPEASLCAPPQPEELLGCSSSHPKHTPGDVAGLHQHTPLSNSAYKNSVMWELSLLAAAGPQVTKSEGASVDAECSLRAPAHLHRKGEQSAGETTFRSNNNKIFSSRMSQSYKKSTMLLKTHAVTLLHCQIHYTVPACPCTQTLRKLNGSDM